MSEGASILLIDDHPAVREGLAMILLRDHHRVCGEAGSRADLLAWLAQLSADRAQLALLDLSLDEESGFDLIDDLARHAIPVLVYSMLEDADTIKKAYALGARGFVCKREASNELLGAIRDVLAGRHYLSPFVAQRLSEPDRSAPLEDDVLSERERQVMTMLGDGDSYAEIANQLGVGTRTVETHCERAIEKLGLRGMKALRRRAIQDRRVN